MSEVVPKQLEPNGTATWVAGADGCRGGWVYVIARIEPAALRFGAISVAASFRALIEATNQCAAVAVDIPIGLSEDGRREADFEARRRIGPRRSSVFPAPARCLTTTAGDYDLLNALSKQVCGRGISRQTYNILPKIVEADACLTPEMQDRVVESHPEVAFWALAGDEPLSYYKRTPEGAAERIRLLETVFGPGIRSLAKPRGSDWDDIYDACVLAWTASHVTKGDAVHLPAEPQYDGRGLRMEIVY